MVALWDVLSLSQHRSDEMFHSCVLGDTHSMVGSLVKHGLSYYSPGFQMAS